MCVNLVSSHFAKIVLSVLRFSGRGFRVSLYRIVSFIDKDGQLLPLQLKASSFLPFLIKLRHHVEFEFRNWTPLAFFS